VLAALHPPQPELSADAATVLDFFDALYQLRALTTPKGGDPGGCLLQGLSMPARFRAWHDPVCKAMKALVTAAPRPHPIVT
jgi:hypothetical protein